jgi:hypothetical protein
LAFKSEYEKYPAPKEQKEKLVAKLGKDVNSSIKSATNSIKQAIPSFESIKGLAKDSISQVNPLTGLKQNFTKK